LPIAKLARSRPVAPPGCPNHGPWAFVSQDRNGELLAS